MKKSVISRRYALLAAALLLPNTAFAATNLPQTDVDVPASKQESTLHSFLPDTKGGDTAAAFRLLHINIEQDGTKLAANVLDEKAAPYLRRAISEADIKELLAALTSYARSHDYPAAAAYLPAQSNQDGTLTIRIIAGRYGKINIENNADIDDAKIKKLTHALKEGATIEGRTLETALYNISALGAIEAGGLLAPGKAFATSDLTIRVRDGKRQNYFLYSENYGSDSSGRYRFGLQATFENLTRSGDRLKLATALSNKDLHNYSFSYSHDIGKYGTVIGIGYSRMDYQLSGNFRLLGAEGTANTLSLFAATPLWRTAQNSLSVTYGWDWRKLNDEYKKVGMELEKHSSTFHLGLRGQNRAENTVIDYNITGYLGHLTPDSNWARTQMRRAKTEGRFTKAVLNVALQQELSERLSLNVNLQAQKAGTNLDSSEEIYLGGANGVRAYPQGEASGDNGFLTNVELYYSTGVPNLTLSTYLDMGSIQYANDGTDGTQTLKGYGIGISYKRPGDYFLRLDWARRIGLASNASESAKANNRFWFMFGKIW